MKKRKVSRRKTKEAESLLPETRRLTDKAITASQPEGISILAAVTQRQNLLLESLCSEIKKLQKALKDCFYSGTTFS
jgi:hypothetical protein